MQIHPSKNIFLTGRGLISPLGNHLDTVFQAMLSGKCGIRNLERFPVENHLQKFAGCLLDADEEILRENHEEDDLALAMILAVAHEAMQEANVADLTKTGLILATNFGFMESLEWCWREHLEYHTMDDETFAKTANILEQCKQKLNISEPAAQISLSCASGVAAVSLASDWLKQERCQSVLVIAYDVLSEFCWTGLSNLRTMTDDALRPFDQNRHGTIFSEGAAAVFLTTENKPSETLQIAATATNNNAFHMTVPAKEGEGSARVIKTVFEKSKLKKIDHFCAHATGTIANDLTEFQALKSVFGKAVNNMTVSGHKSSLGHMLGAAGLAEIVVTSEIMKQGKIPPTIHCLEQDSEIKIDIVKDKVREKVVHSAITNSAGIGGSNSACLLAKNFALSAKSQDNDCFYLKNCGWVLPGTIGSLAQEQFHSEFFTGKQISEDFHLKNYLSTVRGYYDPSSAYFLAASALALKTFADDANLEEFGISTLTKFGCPQTAYKFFQQLVEKEPSSASPLLFSHAYSSVPANLAAIEFGFAGPHMIFTADTKPIELWNNAMFQLNSGNAKNILLGAFEATSTETMPLGKSTTNGAIVFWLSSQGEKNEARSFAECIDILHSVDSENNLSQLSKLINL